MLFVLSLNLIMQKKMPKNKIKNIASRKDYYEVYAKNVLMMTILMIKFILRLIPIFNIFASDR